MNHRSRDASTRVALIESAIVAKTRRPVAAAGRIASDGPVGSSDPDLDLDRLLWIAVRVDTNDFPIAQRPRDGGV